MSTGPQETTTIMMLYTELKRMTMTPQNQKDTKWSLSILRFLHCLGNEKSTSLLISRVTIKRTVNYYKNQSDEGE